MRTLVIYIIAFAFSAGAFAQPGSRWKEKQEKIEAFKIAFITQELDLSPQEAQQFWPVYNELETELKAVRKDKWTNRIEAGMMMDFDIMSDADIEDALRIEFETAEKELTLRKKYFAEFKKVIPMKKVALLYRAEERFKMKLLEELRKRRGEK